jgi:YVTN family beta-propeller protein
MYVTVLALIMLAPTIVHADWVTGTVNTMLSPNHIAVNPVTNRIYVVCPGVAVVTEIDGATLDTAVVPLGGIGANAIAVNPVTDKIYVVNQNSSNVTVIDGETNSTLLVPTGANPCAIAVNPLTNKIYVTDIINSSVMEIDGVTYDTSRVTVGSIPWVLALNPVTNMIYTLNQGSNNITVIDGDDLSTMNVGVGTGPSAIVVNPVTNRIYVANSTGDDVTVIDVVDEKDTGVLVIADEIPNSVVYEATPALSAKAVNRWTPNATRLFGVIDDWMTGQEEWLWATVTSGTGTDSIHVEYTWDGDALMYGENYINAIALESQAGITNNLGYGTPFAGNMMTTPAYYLDGVGPAIAWWDSLPDDTTSAPEDSIFGPYPVRASISDFNGISRVILYWNDDSVAMDHVNADTFMAEIPAQIVVLGDSLIINYSLSAWDDSYDMNMSQTSTRTFSIYHYDLGIADEQNKPEIPTVYALGNVYPNPSKHHAIFRYQIPKRSPVRFDIFDITGRLVKHYNFDHQEPGYYELRWDEQKAAGVYFYRLTAGEYEATKKIVITK